MHAIALTLLLVPGQADVQRCAEEAFAAGLAEREQGASGREQFLAAARYFEELREQGAANALLFRNLGNAYLLADELPRAILAYRLGLRLAPGDRALREALARARERVVFVEGSALGRAPVELRPRWAPPWGPWWTWAVALGLSLAGWGCVARWRMRADGRFLLTGALLLAVAAGASWLVLRARGRPERPVVVLARDGVYLRRGDDAAFPPRYPVPLHRGVEAELLHQSEGWLQIELSGGEVGWVAAREAVRN